jgi:biotin carboxylase
MRSKDPNFNVFVVYITPAIVEFCKDRGINLWTISPELYANLGSKVGIIDVLTKANVPFIPNICSKVESYQQLMGIASKLDA